MKKKLTVFMMIFLIIIHILCLSVFSSEEMIIYVGDSKALLGDEVSVDVYLENNTGFSNIGIEVGYDSSIMTLIDVTSVSEIGAVCTTAPDYEKNPYNISWDSTANNTYNGKLATLTFKINERVSACVTDITVDYYKGRNNDYEDGFDINYDEDGVALPLTYKNGTVTVCEEGKTVFKVELGQVSEQGNIIAVLYDNDGHMLQTKMYTPKESLTVIFDAEGAYSKIFWWDVDSLKPLMNEVIMKEGF